MNRPTLVVNRPRLVGLLAAALLAGPVAACADSAADTDAAPDPTTCGPVTAVVDDAVTPLDPAPQPALPVTVTDAAGDRVTVTDAGRILAVNLYGSIAEIVFSLGLGGRVVGRDTSTDFPAAANLPLVTPGGHDLSTEAVMALDPSVVLLDDSIGPPEVLDQLRAAGIPVVRIGDEQSLAAVPVHIREVAAALGVADAGEALVARVEGEIAAARDGIADDAERPRVAFLYLRGTAGVYLMGGEGAGSDAMIAAAGGEDAGTTIGLARFRPLTSEGLINAAPDIILVMTKGLESVGGVDGLVAMPGVAQTPAGQQRRIVDMDDTVLLNFGTRTGKAIQALARAIHGCR
ncbi:MULTISPECIES: ABC transporter substrate-binding protein [unclassified Solwaraspora]|uniref:heme/hemin ABC transporter substrate-binding protein n=1 Tax=unclassified Solwaraspora TaxID=2627926 RepID=UPI00248CD6F0|nr:MULTISPECIES: ABC transporter substrate-binding protein [unclassified Solwaraspora]WBB95969.1 ABC transporter substrate-binding protein [Solwaraspora sp. WMMA2059]WBC20127.1 ABC transporter substrate-binding protein [Solwaraspora sp. WMMA2080]WJK32286.1 ABC transporter substrate-binding protein [Solwaraspora sp. WMMA2065]